jgi:hypothetical protein
VGEGERYVETMRAVLTGAGKSFVLFENGTVVVFVDAAADVDLEAAAEDLLASFGPVQVGSSAGDFGVLVLPDDRGWAVTSHHPDVLTLLLPDEISADAGELAVGVIGRSKRGRDAEALRVVHIEDRR